MIQLPPWQREIRKSHDKQETARIQRFVHNIDSENNYKGRSLKTALYPVVIWTKKENTIKQSGKQKLQAEPANEGTNETQTKPKVA